MPKRHATADPPALYHAHIYYDPAASKDRAARLREQTALLQNERNDIDITRRRLEASARC